MRFLLKGLGVAFCLSTLGACFAASPIFEPGSAVDQPSEWKSSDPANVREDGALRLSDSLETTEFLSNKITFESRKLYRYSFKMSAVGESGSGCACNGVDFFNSDFYGTEIGDRPSTRYSTVFFTPDGTEGKTSASARFAKWESRRSFCLSEPEIVPVQPLFNLIENKDGQWLPLGGGESIDADGAYEFSSFSSRERSNYDRPLFAANSSFNTDRWGIGRDSSVTYRFELEPCDASTGKLRALEPIPFVSGKIDVRVGYYVKGTLLVEFSLDGEAWDSVGEISSLGGKEISLDDRLADKPTCFFVRFRGKGASADDPGCQVQIHKVTASLKTDRGDRAAFVGVGATTFVDYPNVESVSSAASATLFGVDENENLWAIDNQTEKPFKLTWDSEKLSRGEGSYSDDVSGSPKKISYNLKLGRPATVTRTVYPYFEQDYTKKIANAKVVDKTGSEADLSWCEADYRVPRDPRTREIQDERQIQLVCAKNDFESFQIVLHSGEKGLSDVRARVVGDLKGTDGTSAISGDNVAIRRAYYHYVSLPTDETCAIGWYPDALIPFEQGADGRGAPLNLDPNQNFPIWATIKVDSGSRAGKYSGAIEITANGGDFVALCPFELEALDFALPVKNTLETAYGLYYGNIDNYHNLKTEEDKRLVHEKYLKIFSDYRISTYDPTPLDQFTVEWKPNENPPRCEIDFSAYDKELKRVLDKYHFTNFTVHMRGIGGGTYQNRYEGSIEGYKSDTPEYKAMFADYCHKLQEHLRELGVLDSAYIYCFDEPEEKDYEFVAGEFAKLKKYAPDISRMLTEEPSEKFSKILEEKGASIDVWCPVSPNYSNETAKPQREKGNRFWWYVCCFPKTPYCTEFTDHPAQELRLWHWQTFERNISGCLIWAANYWTSPTAFPDSFQNPYADPACYVHDGAYSPGTKVNWGNGDGRFVYPPLSAAIPGLNDGKPIFDDPCPSVRWEMIREGVEDYETFVILRRLLQEKGEKLSKEENERFAKLLDFSSITKDATHFSDDPQVLLQRRLEIMRAIVELEKK